MQLAGLKASQVHEHDQDAAEKHRLAVLEDTVAEMTKTLAERDAALAEANHRVEDEVNAREAAELESQTLEEALGEEMAELEAQCEDAELQVPYI